MSVKYLSPTNEVAGKFSVMSVCHSVHGEGTGCILCDHYPWCNGPHCTVTTGGKDWRPVQTCSLEDLPHPLVLTSDGYWSTYSWKVGGTHPTGMLSCYVSFCCKMYSHMICNKGEHCLWWRYNRICKFFLCLITCHYFAPLRMMGHASSC